MKRFLPLILCLACLLLPAAPLRAAAEEAERFAVALGDVWFYERADEESKLFLLPETYYVRVLEEGETYCTVEYQTDDPPYRRLLGFCRTDALTFVGHVPARPYLRKQIRVTYSLPDGGELGSGEFTSVERTFVYYGDRTEGGQLYLYVLSGDTFGYLPAEHTPDFERNDDYLTDVSGEAEEPLPGQNAPNAVQIVVIVLACIAAVAVAVILARGKKPPREREEF